MRGRPGRVLALGAGLAVLAAGFAVAPWIATGVTLGGLLFLATVRWPLVVVGILLALGPVDLAFLTGGFRGIAPELGGLDMNGIRLVAVVAGLGFVVIADEKLRGLLVSPHARWFLALLVLGAATIPFSMAPMEGLRLLVKLTWPLLVFLVVAHPDRTRDEHERLADWILIGAAVIVLINPIYVLAGGYGYDFYGRLRIRGLGVHENPFSFYLLFVAILALTRFALRGQLRYLLLTGGALIWIGLTLTRITFLAGLVALVAVGLYAGFVQKNRRMLAAVGGAVVVAGLVFVPFGLERTFGYVPSVPELLALMRDPVLLYQTMDLAGREGFWGVLLASWFASPWLGLGLGSSTAILATLFDPAVLGVAHNEYLRLGTDLGFLGLGVAALAAAAWVRASWRGGDWAYPALATLLAWAVISLTDNPLDYYTTFTQYAAFAVAAALSVRRREDEDATSTGDPGASSPPREAKEEAPRP